MAVGAVPVFVDIHEDTFLMDVSKVEKAITKKTKAILPVDLYGQMADMRALRMICDKHHIKLLEDAAQAHGAEQYGDKPGKRADIASFSFYPGKNLGAYGDAGGIVTNDEALADKIVSIRNHGRKKGTKYEHVIMGFNERMDGMQGAILDAKLRHLDAWIAARRTIAAKYDAQLTGIVEIPHEAPGNKHAYHLYVIKHPNRDALFEHLKKQGIEVGIHYPIPLHLQLAHRDLNLPKGSYPVAERVAGQILSLPIYPEMTDQQITRITSTIKAFSDS